MKIDIKSLILGALLIMLMGNVRTTNVYIRGLRLVKSSDGTAVIVDIKTGKADAVNMNNNKPLKLSQDWNE